MLPNWPARLSEDMAALYLSIGKTAFRQGWQAGRYPKPVRDGKRLFWARQQLDRFVTVQCALEPHGGLKDRTWDDLNSPTSA